MSDDGKSPSLAELVNALSAMRQRDTPEPQGLAKHVGNGMAVIVLAMGFWMANGISNMQRDLAEVSTKVEAIGDTVGKMQQAQNGTGADIGDMKAKAAELAARVTALESSRTSFNDRMRIVEGQKPLSGDDRR